MAGIILWDEVLPASLTRMEHFAFRVVGAGMVLQLASTSDGEVAVLALEL